MKLLRSLLAFSVFTFHAAHAEPPAAAKAATFVRAVERADKTTACETLCAEYRPADGRGPAVWLFGVAHLGTAEYYRALQERLDRQSVVLFEGVGLDDAVQRGPGAATHQAGIQTGLAKALGLVFQLDAIDYRRPNFINSDLKADKLAGKVQERAKDTPDKESGEMLGVLMDALHGSGAVGEMMNRVVSVLGETPAMREMTKAILVEALGHAEEFLSLSRGVSPEMDGLLEVILTERNAVVLADLRTQLTRRAPGESVAIFYGAAHMAEIARRLRDELHYVPAREEWLPAFTADPAKGGINPVQLRFLIEMTKMQLKALQGPAKK